MEEALRDLESAEDKVVRIMEIAAKVTGALADPNAAKAQEELALCNVQVAHAAEEHRSSQSVPRSRLRSLRATLPRWDDTPTQNQTYLQ